MAKQVISLLVARFDQKAEPVRSCGGYWRFRSQIRTSTRFWINSCCRSPDLMEVGSGAQDSLQDQELVVQVGCGLEHLPSPFTTTALEGGG